VLFQPVAPPPYILPRVAGEETGGGWNAWNDWNGAQRAIRGSEAARSGEGSDRSVFFQDLFNPLDNFGRLGNGYLDFLL
jgi:hypothetical protein